MKGLRTAWRTALMAVTIFVLLPALPCYLNGESNADDAFSSWSYWPDSDSLQIMATRSMAWQKSVRLNRAEEIATYSGSTLWTNTFSLIAVGSALYENSTNGLRVYDISDIENPVEVKRIYLGFTIGHEILSYCGNFLYVSRNDRLYIFDISDPLNPQQLSVTVLTGFIMQVHVENDRAYCGIARYNNEYDDNPAFYILDIGDPSNPTIIGKYESPYPHKDCRLFAKIGDYIYSLNSWDKLMETISITDETQPVQVACDSITYPICMTSHNGYLYVGYWDTLSVYDISNPESPVECALCTGGTPHSLDILDNRLYVSYEDHAEKDGYVLIYDILPDGSLDSVSFFDTRRSAYCMAIMDSALLLPEYFEGFSLFDISNPDSVAILAEFDNPCSRLMGLDVGAGYAYLTNQVSYFGGTDRNGLYTVDIGDNQNPQAVDYVFMTSNTETVNVMDTLAFVTGGMQNYIFSLSDPANPTFLSQYLPDARVDYARDTIMFVLRVHELQIASIANPANPSQISAIELDLAVYRGLLANDLMYVVAWGNDNFGNWLQSLVTFDISDLTNPFVEDILFVDSLGIISGGLAKYGSRLYCTGSDQGFSIIDISDPRAPEKAGQSPMIFDDIFGPVGRFYTDAAVKTGLLFVTAINTLQIYDLEDPLNPQLIQFLTFPSPLEELKIQGNYLYISSWCGFLILQLNLPPAECGDANYDSMVNISDAVYIINYIFAGGEVPEDYASADVNCDTTVNVSDAVWIINYIFVSGNQPCDVDGDNETDC